MDLAPFPSFQTKGEPLKPTSLSSTERARAALTKSRSSWRGRLRDAWTAEAVISR